MSTSFFSRFKSTLTGLLLISAFISVEAVDSLGTWAAKNPGLSTTGNYDIYGMAYGNNMFVIVGQDFNAGKAFTANSMSGDAKSWIVRASGSASEGFNSVIFSSGRFIAVCKQPDSGNARIWTSDDNGNTWKTRNSDNAGLIVTGGLHAVASNGNGKLVAAGSDPDGKGWITVSTDNGTTWRVVRDGGGAKFFPGNRFYGVGYAIGNWYAVSTGRTYKSSDAGTWTDIGGPAAGSLGYKVASNETTIIVASSAGPQWTADHGATWHPGIQANGFGGVTSLTQTASSIVYGDGYFVLTTLNAGDVWVSETGRYWKRWELPTNDNTYALCYAKKAFWCGGWWEKISKSPSWFKARNGCSSDYPYTLFDAEDGPPNRIGLPQYRINTASLNLVLESTLFYATTLCSPINFKLVYNSQPTPDGDASIGLFGKNWKFRYESVIGRFGQEARVMAGGGRTHTFATPKGEDLDTYSNAAELFLAAPDGIFDTLKYIYNGGSPRFELTLKKSHLTYVYSTAGNGANNVGLFYLSAIKDQFGNTTNLAVTAANGQITRITDAANRQFNFNYSSGLCSSISIPGGRSVSFTYDAQKNLKTITDMMGYVGTYTYDEASKFPADSPPANLGFLTAMNTTGKINTFTYDERPGYEAGTVENPGDMYVTSITRANGTKITYEILEDGETVKRTDASGQTTLISNKDGQTTSVADPLGNLRTITYNGTKLPETITDEKGGVFKYTYDDGKTVPANKGNLLTKTDALGNVTTYTYDNATSDLLKVKNALNQEWTYTYANYLPISITSPAPLGNLTNLAYYGNGRLKNLTDARGKTTGFEYDIYGNLTKATPPVGGASILAYAGNAFRCTSMTDGNGKSKTINWDNNDRITTIAYTSAGGISYTNEYDAFGQVKFTDEIGNATTVARDDLGYVTTVTNPLTFTTQTEYDADNRPTKTTDPLGRTTSTSYDNAGRPILFTDARGFKVVKEYDGTGNLVSFKDKNGSETKYTYDANNRLLTTTDPLKKASTITRDALGRISSFKNARGQTITYTYDNDGRLKKKESKLTTAGASTVIAEYTRDGNGNILTQKDAWGTTDATATKYEYDDSNRITKTTYPDTKAVSMTYNSGGNIASIIYPDGLVTTYTYDNFNRQPVPSVLKNNPGTELVGESRSTNAITSIAITGPATGNYTLNYNNRGNILKITRPNGIETGYSYDKAGRITQVKHSANAGLENLFSADYAPDAVGNISSESFSGSAYFSSPQSLANMTLSYNVAGGLTKKGTKACTSDADGNLTSLDAGEVKCTYDPLNRLTQLVKKEGKVITTVINTYNAEGLRVKKEIVGGETVIYHYLPTGILLFTTDANGAVLDRHIYAGKALLSTYKANGDWIHYFGDRQAHVRFIADNTLPTGAVLVKYDYLPYGKVDSSKLGINDAAIDKNPFTFNGIIGVQDEGNSLFCMQQRFYEAASARFLSRDPLGFDVGPNLYGFGNNNPIAYLDPSGKHPLVAVLVIGTFIWGATEAVSAIRSFGKSASDYVENSKKDDELCKNNREAWLNQQGRENNEKKAAEIEAFAKEGARTALKVEAFRFSPTSENLGEVAVDQARGATIDYATTEQNEDGTASGTNELPPPQQQTEGEE
jgi:RHS repeat-associated protein